MVAKSILKLIDEAIIPAMILILAKILAIIAFSNLFKAEYQINYKGILNIIPTIAYSSPNDFIRVENYSNLVMFTAASIGALLILIKAHYLHSSHISPKFNQKLVKVKFENFILPSFHLYHQALIWMIFLWLSTAFLILSSIAKITYPQISVIATIIAINFSWILAMDIQKEIEISNDKNV